MPEAEPMNSRQLGAVRWQRDDTGVVTITFDDPGRVGNLMNARWLEGMRAALDEVDASAGDTRGVVLTSAKRSFFSGDDWAEDEVPDDEMAASYGLQPRVKELLRRMEQLPVPVAAALVGSAMGGGFEIALAAHHRVGCASEGVIYALPEITWRVLPACGGVVRSVRTVGVVPAVIEVLLTGRHLSATEARDLGLVDAVGEDRRDVVERAKAWVLAQGRDYSHPLNDPGSVIPGSIPAEEDAAEFLANHAPHLLPVLSGDSAQAARSIYDVARRGALTDLDSALELETAAFRELISRLS